MLGRAGPAREAHDRGALEPRRVDLGLVVDEVAGHAPLLRHLGQPVRVRGILRADHEQHVDLRHELLHRVLAVLGRVADVLPGRALEGRIALLQHPDDLARLVHRQGGLRQVRERPVRREIDHARLRLGLHQHGAVRRLAARALDLLVPGVADQHDGPIVRGEAARLDVHLGDERTGRIDQLEAASASLVEDRRGRAVRREHRDRALRAPRRAPRRTPRPSPRGRARRAGCARSACGRTPGRRAWRAPVRPPRRPARPPRNTLAAPRGAHVSRTSTYHHARTVEHDSRSQVGCRNLRAARRVVPPSDGRLPVRPPFPARSRASRLPRVWLARACVLEGGRGRARRMGRSHVGRRTQEVMETPATDRGEVRAPANRSPRRGDGTQLPAPSAAGVNCL